MSIASEPALPIDESELPPPRPQAPAPSDPPSRGWAILLNVFAAGFGVARMGHERLGWAIFVVVNLSVLLIRFGFWGLMVWLGLILASWISAAVVPRRGVPESSAKQQFFIRLAFGGVFLGLVQTYYVSGFKIPSGSNIPTVQVGDRIYVDKLVYALHAPERGDMMVFTYPREPSKQFIKRVVGVPGDRIEVKNNVLTVNGQAVAREPVGGDCSFEDYDEMKTQHWETKRCAAFTERLGGHVYQTVDALDDYNKDFPGAGDPNPYVVPKDSYFTVGDNRNNSHDSRFWGPVPGKYVIGKALYVYWSRGPKGLRSERIGRHIE